MDTKSGYLSNLFIEEVHIKQGFNPRKFFDDKEYRELAESVVSNGIIQSIVVRPTHDEIGGYWVVAGERRYRAAKDAQLAHIPALVREMTDQEAMLIATLENTQRADMSPAEEAQAARDVLMGCDNDRQEAVKLLGWSQAKFDSRLLLLHAAPDVLTTLTERKIKLGHAELLSQLPHDFQTATLSKILESGYTVAELKSRLSLFALELSKACFNTAECNGCPHNSTMQASLFDEHINDGQCANRECFEQKTEAAMVEKKASLSEQYAVVYLDTERRPDSYKIVCQSGIEGLGKSQLEQGCRQCAHFGAVLSTSPDRLGRITEDCCFNLVCHQEKVVGYQKSVKAASATAAEGDQSSKSATNISPSVPKSATQPSGEGDGGTQASVAAIPNRVIEKIELFYRELAAQQVSSNKLAVLCLNTFALYKLVRGTLPNELLPKSVQENGRFGFEIDAFVKTFSELGIEETLSFNHKLLSHLLGEHEKATPILNKTWAMGAASVLNVTQAKLTEHFLLDKKFLGSFTKAGIEGVLREAVNGVGVGFVEHYEMLDERNKFPALMKKKNGEILDDVFGCGFDFSGFVPSCVFKFMREDNVAAAAGEQGAIDSSRGVADAAEPIEQSAVEPLDEDDDVLDQLLTSNNDYLDVDLDPESSGSYDDFDLTQDIEESDEEQFYV